MADIIGELLDQQVIPKYLEGIVDPDTTWAIHEINTESGAWIGTGENGIIINERESERCLIKYELWDGPPHSLDSWDRTWTGSVRFSSGKVIAISGHSGGTDYGQEFNLAQQNTVWNVRVHRKSLGYEDFTPEIVSFTLLKLQFWAAPL